MKLLGKAHSAPTDPNPVTREPTAPGTRTYRDHTFQVRDVSIVSPVGERRAGVWAAAQDWIVIEPVLCDEGHVSTRVFVESTFARARDALSLRLWRKMMNAAAAFQWVDWMQSRRAAPGPLSARLMAVSNRPWRWATRHPVNGLEAR